jgi:hypothetical protein
MAACGAELHQVIDPFEVKRNCAAAVKSNLPRIVGEFQRAVNLLQSGNPQDVSKVFDVANKGRY